MSLRPLHPICLLLALLLVSCSPAPVQAAPATPPATPVAPTAHPTRLPVQTPAPTMPAGTAIPTVAVPALRETYCLWPGDTLDDISGYAGASVESILAYNKYYTGFAGSTLQLPPGSLAPAQWPLPQPVFTNTDQLPMGESGIYLGYDNRKKQVALTFDIGFEPADEQLVSMLAGRGVRATFFVVGNSVARHPEIITDILKNGHELGNHSWSHINMQWMTAEQVSAELELTEFAVRKASPGATTRPFFRAPFGALTPTVLAVLRKQGYSPVGWTIDSHDWMDDISSREIVQRVTGSVCPGAIISMHDANPANTIALPQILDFLDRNGYATVPLSELLLPGK